ncbi:BspA family leucine-rich repeat surface protein [Jejuia spongiicola]|uniref:BspA family leucine-rich repeat surface protein n=1 Tax=Jejuia spongiicola TaxID=2942207 RepID=A0ABT0QC20_9FLAO|nr:BspA family leucine-rich repeat surface protein [Jejuia spongiicola]MCL6294525.1 BspA family leucine-rich repeat surface protein [Jejuia spongiicola]
MKATPPLIYIVLFVFSFSIQSVNAQCTPINDIGQFNQNDTRKTTLASGVQGQTFIASCSGNIVGVTFSTDYAETTTTARVAVGNDTDGQRTKSFTLFASTNERRTYTVTFGGYAVTAGEMYFFKLFDGEGANLTEKSGSPYPSGNMFEGNEDFTNSDLKFIVHYEGADTFAPVAQCKSIEINLDSNGQYTLTPEEINDGSYDIGISGIASMAVSPNTFECSDIEDQHNVTLTVTDGNGLTDTCTTFVYVRSKISPGLQCSDIIVNAAPGACRAIVDLEAYNNITFNNTICVIASEAYTGMPFGGYPVGSTAITYEVETAGGINESCTFNVIVEDTEAPVINNCPGAITLLENQILPTPSISADDNCSASNELTLVRIDNGPAFGTVPTTNFTVQLALEDSAGNQSSVCSYNVIVDTAPVLSCESSITIPAEGTLNVTPEIVGQATNDLSEAISFAFGTGTEVSVVLDSNSPTDELISSFPVFGYQLFELKPPATGNYTLTVSGDQSSTLFIWEDAFNPNAGNYYDRDGYLNVVEFTSNGNIDTPNGTNTLMLQSSKTYYASVIRNDGNNTGNFNGTLAFSSEMMYLNSPDIPIDCADIGSSIPINLYAFESNGQSSNCMVDLAIEASGPIISGCETINESIDEISIVLSDGSCGGILEGIVLTAEPGSPCTTIPDGLVQTSALGIGDVFPVGRSIVSYTATDNLGNTTSCSFEVQVIETVAPEFTNCPEDITVPITPGSAGAVVTFTDLVATDNCGSSEDLEITQTSGLPSGSFFPVGVTQQTFEVTDGFNKGVLCSFTITVEDTNSPVINCQDVAVGEYPDVATGYVITPSDFDNGSTDDSGQLHFLTENNTFYLNIDTSNNEDLGKYYEPSTFTVPFTRNYTFDFDIEIEDNGVTGAESQFTYHIWDYPPTADELAERQGYIGGATIDSETNTIVGGSNTYFMYPNTVYYLYVYGADVTSSTFQSLTGTITTNTNNIRSSLPIIIGCDSPSTLDVTLYATDAAANTATCSASVSNIDCADPVVLRIETASDNQNFNLPLDQYSNETYAVDWGDGTYVTGYDDFTSHVYFGAGEYFIKIYGNIGGFRYDFSSTNDREALKAVESWGNNVWLSFQFAFPSCNLTLPEAPPNLSNVTKMGSAFSKAVITNPEVLGDWDVSNIISMGNMFKEVVNFNPDISTWNVSKVTNMASMFEGAIGFDQDLSTWDISSLEQAANMFNNSGLSIENYDALLIGWNTLDTNAVETAIPQGVTFGAEGINYCIANEERDNLIQNQGWTILDDGRVNCAAMDPLVTKWRTNNDGASNDNQITIRTIQGETYNYNVNWGDGTTSTGLTGDFLHTYAQPGVYEVSITGDFPGFQFNNDAEAPKIIEVSDWGDIIYRSFEGAFWGCINLQITATNAPNLSQVTSMKGTFYNAGGNLNIENWDVSNVENMSQLFNENNSFNRDISSWNVSKVTNMSEMFAFASAFNQDLSNWNVSNVTDMTAMFAFVSTFNQDIGNWNVSSVTNMSEMFTEAYTFNQDLSNWDVSNVTGMSDMFANASSFNQDLSNWDVSNVTDMSSMFANASFFNQDLGNWDISSLENAARMFENVALSTENYEALLVGWSTLDTNETQIPQDITFSAGNSTYCEALDERNTLKREFGWNITDGGVEDPSCFLNGRPFITKWSIVRARGIFISIPLPIDLPGPYNYVIDWGDGSALEHYQGRGARHGYPNRTATYEVKIYGVFPSIDFSTSDVFDQRKIIEVMQWGDIEWTTMEGAFAGCTNLEYTATDIPDLSKVTSMEDMFSGCTSLVGNDSFNNWDTSNVTNMRNTFASTNFNEDIGGWNVSNVTDMYRMFVSSKAFNQDIGGWDVSNVTNMAYMFTFSKAFNQDIGNWDISSLSDATGMFSNNTTFSTANYDALLIGWSTQDSGETIIPSGITFDAPEISYCTGESGRSQLLSQGWTIEDAGLDCSNVAFFTTKWDATNGMNITIPTSPDEVYNYIVDWGDGTSESNITGDVSHTYTTPDTYEVKIYGVFPRIDFSNSTDENKAKIIEVVQWGDILWTSMENAFSGCSNLIVTASDVPNLSNVSNLRNMFFQCSNFNSDINNWDVSNVTNMQAMFYGCSNFNSDINNWDVSNVTHMNSMFYGCADFNQPLNDWDVSNVTHMNSMFAFATSFDQNLGDWDITSFDQVFSMFDGVTLSTENYDALLIGWATQEVGEGPIPSSLSFNGGGSKYCDGEAARTELSSAYDWSIVDGNQDLLCGIEPFITTWKTTTPFDIITIPTTGSGYNYIVDWGDGIISTGLTGDASHTYPTPDTYEVKIYGDFPRIYFYSSDQSNRNKLESIEQWGDIEWASMNRAFYGCENLKITNPDIDEPDLSNVTSIESMFIDCINFDGDISNWDVSNIIYMDHMFNGCINFNQPLNNWDVSNVIGMSNMFSGATSFDQNLGDWDITNLQYGAEMFTNVTLSTENYDALLIGWSTQEAGEGPIPTDLELNAGGSQYCLGGDAKTLLEGLGWDIYDNGLDFTCPSSNFSPFITKWNVEAGESITIPTVGDGYNYTVDWGDGIISTGLTGDAFHTYVSEEEYEVKIYGDFPRIYFPNSDESIDKIVDVIQWGDIQWTSMEEAFNNCSNLNISATDAPDLSNVTSMSVMFRGCSSLVGTPAFNNWDVSGVTTMNAMFGLAASFNQPLGNWQTGNVINMAGMFLGATSFNQDIGHWDVSNVTDMSAMFLGANSFNQDLGDWDISNITNMGNMLLNVQLSISNYDALLIGWAEDTSDGGAGDGIDDVPSNVIFGANLSNYCLGEDARTELLNLGWTINDGAKECSNLSFVTRWETTAPNQTITLPIVPNGSVIIIWGDGSAEPVSNNNPTHQYSEVRDDYIITVIGRIESIKFGNTGSESNILEIMAWGDNPSWNTMEEAFFLCQNLDITATDTPNLSNVSSMELMFAGCENLVGTPAFNDWDVSNVTNMKDMFISAILFNQPLDQWNVSNVSNMSSMFFGAETFNQDIGNWNVSTVSNMSSMFLGAGAFNQNLGAWDISSLSNASNMLTSAQLSIENYDNTLIGWATLDVDEAQIPQNATFSGGSNQYCFAEDARNDLEIMYGWNITDGGQNTQCSGEEAFITKWQLEDDDLEFTFPIVEGETYYYQIDWGDGSPVQTTTEALTHDYALTDGNGGVKTIAIKGIFPRVRIAPYIDSGFGPELDTSSAILEKIVEISQWGNIQWSSMEEAFAFCENLDVTATDTPNLSQVTSIKAMFQSCNSLVGTSAFNNWDTFNIINMEELFLDAFSFNQAIGNWNVGNVELMSSMFSGALEFNQPIENWNVSNVTSMVSMFRRASNFNQPLADWNVSNVIEMERMFSTSTKFNQDLNDWDVSNVKNMEGMFSAALAFNQPLNNWQTGNVLNMKGMFEFAENFNQDLNDWDVSNVSNMAFMFNSASNFNQSLSNWDLSSINISFNGIFLHTNLDRSNYDATLIGWAEDTSDGGAGDGVDDIPQSSNTSFISLNSSPLIYCDGESARQALIDDYGWSITGDTKDCSDFVVVSPKVYLQGASLKPNLGEENLMRDDLRVNDLIPITSPYADMLQGGSVLNVAGSRAMVDWIWVELRDVSDPTIVVAGKSAILQRDGTIQSEEYFEKIPDVRFDNVPAGDYYVAVKHRNHLGIMSANTVALSVSPTEVDFTDGSVPTYGINAQIDLSFTGAGPMAMLAGDADGNGFVNISGTGDSGKLSTKLYSEPDNTAFSLSYTGIEGYYNEDLDMDGKVLYSAGGDFTQLQTMMYTHPGNTGFSLSFSGYTTQLPIGVTTSKSLTTKEVVKTPKTITVEYIEINDKLEKESTFITYPVKH